MRKQAIFWFFILLSTGLPAQSPLYSNYNRYKVEDGLPQSFVSGIVQDKDGFIWIGTRDGLARYDGRSFKVFRKKNNDSRELSSNVITDLVIDHQNLLWVFYVNEKLDCFDPRKMQVVFRDSFNTVRQLAASLKTKRFYRDLSGNFWFYSIKNGVASYDPQKNQTTWFSEKNKNLSSNLIAGICEYPGKGICVFTDKAIEIFDPVKKSKKEIIFFNSPFFSFRPDSHSVAVLPGGRFYISSKDRLISINSSTKSTTAYSFPRIRDANGIIQHLQTMGDSILLIVGGGGIYKLDSKGNTVSLWEADDRNLFARDARSFLADRSGVLWFGTNASGMYSINLRSLPVVSHPNQMNFTADILSSIPGLEKKIPSSITNERAAYGLRYCYDRNHVLWISHRENESTDGPVNIYKISNGEIAKAIFPPGNYPAIRGLSEDTNGDMYAIDVKGNMWRWKNGSDLPEFIPTSLSLAASTTVVDFESDRATFWVATNKQGLLRIKNNKIQEQYTEQKKPAWPADQLTDICPDPADNNILWIGSLGGGLIRFEKGQGSFRVMTTDDGLPNNTVYSIIPDEKGNLWMSTNNGICCYDQSSKKFFNLDVRDGLAGNEFNRFHHIKLPDGRIAFGGPDGISSFDPSLFVKDDYPTAIALTRFLINNKPVEFTGNSEGLPGPLNAITEITLPFNKNFLQFEFAGLEFNEPGKLKYRYMMEGVDKNWVESGSYNVAAYTRLSPGRYRLLLNASNTSGEWSPVIKELAIRIKPPLWATWWAWTFYILVIVLLVRLYWKYHVNRIRLQNKVMLEEGKARQLKELDEIKDRFFANITHELRTPLTLIMTPVEKIKQDNQYSPADQRILNGVYKNAEQLLRLINQLLDISKIESRQMKLDERAGDFAGFAEKTVQQFSAEAGARKIELIFINKKLTGLYLFDEDKWGKIIFNLLGNAIKFTPGGGKITVSVSAETKDAQQNENIELSVTDTGHGISSADIPRLFNRFYMVDDSLTKTKAGTGIGLALVKELVTLMNGTIHVESSPGNGSRFNVVIPLKKIETSARPALDKKMKQESSTRNPEIILKDVQKHLVLVVEDNEELLSFIGESLEPNWQVLKASNGEAAWELILKELPDYVISDVMMPGMNGYELCQRVKQDPRTGHIFFILLTARSGTESRIQGLQGGADEYLTKPFHFDELELRLFNLVKQQARLQQHFRKKFLPETPLEKLPHLDDIFIQELYTHLDHLLTDPGFSVEVLAQKMAMSQRTLNRKLKALLNLTPVECIRRYRLQKAAVLISSGHSISDAAYSVGFDTASYFTQCFKEEFGKTPSEFLSQKTA